MQEQNTKVDMQMAFWETMKEKYEQRNEVLSQKEALLRERIASLKGAISGKSLEFCESSDSVPVKLESDPNEKRPFGIVDCIVANASKLLTFGRKKEFLPIPNSSTDNSIEMLKSVVTEFSSSDNSVSQEELSLKRVQPLLSMESSINIDSYPSDLEKQENDMRIQLRELESREESYKSALAEFQDIISTNSFLKENDALQAEYNTLAKDLGTENKLLKLELEDLKLELKHCLERIEGPMKNKLELEITKCNKLEQEITSVKNGLCARQDSYLKELNKVKQHLCMACSNMFNLTNNNMQLKETLGALEQKCALLEDDLLKQKISEAETIIRFKDVLTSKDNLQTPAVYQTNIQAYSFKKYDENSIESMHESLGHIARQLSLTLKDIGPCGSCKDVPSVLKRTMNEIKQLSDLVDAKNKRSKSESPKFATKNSPESKRSLSQVSKFKNEPILPSNSCQRCNGDLFDSNFDLCSTCFRGICPDFQKNNPKDSDFQKNSNTPKDGLKQPDKNDFFTQTSPKNTPQIRSPKDGSSLVQQYEKCGKEITVIRACRGNVENCNCQKPNCVCHKPNKQQTDNSRPCHSPITTPLSEKEPQNNPKFLNKPTNPYYAITPPYSRGSADPSKVIVSRTVTQSGVMEITSQGPPGIIETKLLYLDDGTIEVITQLADTDHPKESVVLSNAKFEDSSVLFKHLEGLGATRGPTVRDQLQNITSQSPKEQPKIKQEIEEDWIIPQVLSELEKSVVFDRKKTIKMIPGPGLSRRYFVPGIDDQIIEVEILDPQELINGPKKNQDLQKQEEPKIDKKSSPQNKLESVPKSPVKKYFMKENDGNIVEVEMLQEVVEEKIDPRFVFDLEKNVSFDKSKYLRLVPNRHAKQFYVRTPNNKIIQVALEVEEEEVQPQQKTILEKTPEKSEQSSNKQYFVRDQNNQCWENDLEPNIKDNNMQADVPPFDQTQPIKIVRSENGRNHYFARDLNNELIEVEIINQADEETVTSSYVSGLEKGVSFDKNKKVKYIKGKNRLFVPGVDDFEHEIELENDDLIDEPITEKSSKSTKNYATPQLSTRIKLRDNIMDESATENSSNDNSKNTFDDTITLDSTVLSSKNDKKKPLEDTVVQFSMPQKTGFGQLKNENLTTNEINFVIPREVNFSNTAYLEEENFMHVVSTEDLLPNSGKNSRPQSRSFEENSTFCRTQSIRSSKSEILADNLRSPPKKIKKTVLEEGDFAHKNMEEPILEKHQQKKNDKYETFREKNKHLHTNKFIMNTNIFAFNCMVQTTFQEPKYLPPPIFQKPSLEERIDLILQIDPLKDIPISHSQSCSCIDCLYLGPIQKKKLQENLYTEIGHNNDVHGDGCSCIECLYEKPFAKAYNAKMTGVDPEIPDEPMNCDEEHCPYITPDGDQPEVTEKLMDPDVLGALNMPPDDGTGGKKHPDDKPFDDDDDCKCQKCDCKICDCAPCPDLSPRVCDCSPPCSCDECPDFPGKKGPKKTSDIPPEKPPTIKPATEPPKEPIEPLGAKTDPPKGQEPLQKLPDDLPAPKDEKEPLKSPPSEPKNKEPSQEPLKQPSDTPITPKPQESPTEPQVLPPSVEKPQDLSKEPPKTMSSPQMPSEPQETPKEPLGTPESKTGPIGAPEAPLEAPEPPKGTSGPLGASEMPPESQGAPEGLMPKEEAPKSSPELPKTDSKVSTPSYGPPNEDGVPQPPKKGPQDQDGSIKDEKSQEKVASDPNVKKSSGELPKKEPSDQEAKPPEEPQKVPSGGSGGDDKDPNKDKDKEEQEPPKEPPKKVKPCDCAPVCDCPDCPDPNIKKPPKKEACDCPPPCECPGEAPKPKEEVPPKEDKEYCGKCDCAPCECPGKAVLAKGPCDLCDCNPCACPGAKQKADKQTGDVCGNIKCTCDPCQCPGKCTCDPCQCPGKGPSNKCNCPDCTCAPCPVRTLKGPPSSILRFKDSSKPTSKALVSKGSTVKICDCSPCRCWPCVFKQGQNVVQSSAIQSGTCDCNPCKCMPCPKKTNQCLTITPVKHANDCDCPKCVCKSCPDLKKSQKSIPLVQTKSLPNECDCTTTCKCTVCSFKPTQSAPTVAVTSAPHKDGCDCSQCRCITCSGTPNTAPQQTPNTCTCTKPCKCKDCPFKNKLKPCDCTPPCQCKDCPDKSPKVVSKLLKCYPVIPPKVVIDPKIKACDCKTPCVCKDCPGLDSKKSKTEQKPKNPCDCIGVCTCKPCLDPNKAEKKPKKCDCMIKCDCAPCGDPNKKKGIIRPCDCVGECKCDKCKPAGPKKGEIRPCDCVGICKCDICNSKKPQIRSCDCVGICKCDDCSSKKPQIRPCNCVGECKCDKCEKPAEPRKKSSIRTCDCVGTCKCDQCIKGTPSKAPQKGEIRPCDCVGPCKCDTSKKTQTKIPPCDCAICKCDHCPDKGKKRPDAPKKGQTPQIRPCDCPICKCNGQPEIIYICKCKPCIKKQPPSGTPQKVGGTAPKINPCDCVKCVCDKCPDPNLKKKDQKGGDGGLKCTCRLCSCDPCEDPQKNKKKEEPPSGPPCDCPVCVCDPCSDRNFVKPLETKKKNIKPCDCTPTCKCPKCPDPKMAPKTCDCVGVCNCAPCKDPQGPQNAKLRSQPADANKCTCDPPCVCDPCEFKTPLQSMSRIKDAKSTKNGKDPKLPPPLAPPKVEFMPSGAPKVKCDCPPDNCDCEPCADDDRQKPCNCKGKCECNPCPDKNMGGKGGPPKGGSCGPAPTEPPHDVNCQCKPCASKKSVENKTPHIRDCDCPICKCDDGFAQNLKKGNVAKAISDAEKMIPTSENRLPKQNDIAQVLKDIQCACLEAERLPKEKNKKKKKNCECNTDRTFLENANRLVKKASPFQQTISKMHIQLQAMQQKCLEKDKLIESIANELKVQETDPTFFTRVIRNLAAYKNKLPDYERWDISKTFPYPISDRPGLRLDKFETALEPIQELDLQQECICPSIKSMEVLDVRRVGQDSLLIKWQQPKASNKVLGYQIYIDGILKHKVFSGTRCNAVVGTLDLNNSVEIALYAVTINGRCEPPALASYTM